MRVLTQIVLCTFLLAILMPCSWAKGVTVQITISGETLPEPIVITDPDVVGAFSIWSGPNSRWRSRNGPWQTDYSGIFVDFPGGNVPPPADDFFRFDVEFYVARTPTDPPYDKTYRVLYSIEPSEAGGYMYIARGNPFITHDVEGSWFRSTESWEALVRPIIEEVLIEQPVRNNKLDESGV